MMDIDNPTPEQIKKAAAYFDIIKRAKEHGKDWWAHAEIARLEIQIEQDRRIIVLMDACERAEGWIATVPDGLRMRDIMRAAIMDAGGPLPDHYAPPR